MAKTDVEEIPYRNPNCSLRAAESKQQVHKTTDHTFNTDNNDDTVWFILDATLHQTGVMHGST